jgi:uncharacterized protein involved in exopolysaccharide biosynthesis
MYETFDPFEYVEYLRRRWRLAAAACGVALLLSVTATLLTSKRYTATASIIIEPPSGSDPRVATAVSPGYLESLRTYERFAASDTLFARAVEKFHLQDPQAPRSIESLKRSVLKVSKLRDTKILEISATLRDPKLAQSFAQYIAEEAAEMSRGESLASDRELADEAQKLKNDAELRLQAAEKDWTSEATHESLTGLQSRVETNTELQGKLRQELIAAEADAADYQERAKTGGEQFAKQQVDSARARAALLATRLQELDRAIREDSQTLSKRMAQRDELQAHLDSARADYERVLDRVRDLRASNGMRGERLRLIDPGIVPQRPSSPNIGLNVIAALLVALTASLVWLSLRYAWRGRTLEFERPLSRELHR